MILALDAFFPVAGACRRLALCAQDGTAVLAQNRSACAADGRRHVLVAKVFPAIDACV